MKMVAKLGSELTNEERKLLSNAYLGLINKKRNGWFIIATIVEQKKKTEENEEKQQSAKQYLEKLGCEIREICYDVLVSLSFILEIQKSGIG